MASGIFSTREANVSRNTNQTATWNQDAKNLMPDLFKLLKELFVILDVAQLSIPIIVLFKFPVRRRSKNQVDRLIVKKAKIACIALNQSVSCWVILKFCFPRVFADYFQCRWCELFSNRNLFM